ncbi:HK97 family phage prohead protease [Bacteroides zhangwenhongii]|jgi:HK97 family phage prohead protease|uniref:HK97 family phage prohead protease n=1 Tax=Bacteroides zhangwenhongii TaxID=2650157 RepID=UPI0020554188|nr:HK97 family phage prohead protease [Bacteroides zhangwenhongii]DAT68390.1 MAG TPA: prohead serine protease [Caudoviricetes sp.]
MKKDTNKEIRYINEIQSADSESRKVEGYALVFNSESEDLGFIETIEKDAIDDEVIAKSDVFALMNHDNNRGILARSRRGKGSLSLTIDEKGLKYSFDAPKTALGNELLEMLRRNDITSSSFAFTVASDGEKWEKRDGKYYRTITKIDRLYDVSPVYCPAYSETSVACRSFNDILKIESDNLTQYWDSLDKEIDSIE